MRKLENCVGGTLQKLLHFTRFKILISFAGELKRKKATDVKFMLR